MGLFDLKGYLQTVKTIVRSITSNWILIYGSCKIGRNKA